MPCHAKIIILGHFKTVTLSKVRKPRPPKVVGGHRSLRGRAWRHSRDDFHSGSTQHPQPRVPQITEQSQWDIPSPEGSPSGVHKVAGQAHRAHRTRLGGGESAPNCPL